MAEFRGIQDGLKVFYVRDPAMEGAERTTCTYALQHAQNGDVTVQRKIDNRWKDVMVLARGSKSAFFTRPEGIKNRGFASRTKEQRRDAALKGVAARLAKKTD